MKWEYSIFVGSREEGLAQCFCSISAPPNTRIIIENPWRVIDYFTNGYVYEFKDGKGKLFFLVNTQPNNKNKHKVYVNFDKVTNHINFSAVEDSNEV